MMVERKLDGTVDGSSADQEIHKFDAIVHNQYSVKKSGLEAFISRTGT